MRGGTEKSIIRGVDIRQSQYETGKHILLLYIFFQILLVSYLLLLVKFVPFFPLYFITLNIVKNVIRQKKQFHVLFYVKKYKKIYLNWR